MIKHINHQNFLTTPFVAAKSWHLYNRNPDDLVILENTGSEDTVALEYTDYSTDEPFSNGLCSIALEQQGSDLINYQEGITGSGKFYPDREATNNDGTFKRLVHSQIKATFYNKYNDPTKIFGVDYIDFPLGNTFRDLSSFTRIFNIPRHVFGERVVENTVRLNDAALDDNVEIVDDGYQNLIARPNLFSKVQELRAFGNIIMSGSSSYDCYNDHVDVAVVESGSFRLSFVGGSIDNVSNEDTANFGIAFYTASISLEIISGSGADTGSMGFAFYTGSLVDNVIPVSGSFETGSFEMAFNTGSLFTEIVTASIVQISQFDTGSIGVVFNTGSLFDEVKLGSGADTGSAAIAFLSGVLT